MHLGLGIFGVGMAFLFTEILNLMLLLYVIFRFDLLPKSRFNLGKTINLTIFKESKPLLKLIIPNYFQYLCDNFSYYSLSILLAKQSTL